MIKTMHRIKINQNGLHLDDTTSFITLAQGINEIMDFLDYLDKKGK